MSNLSNFPPGHPTGVQTTEGRWGICQGCESVMDMDPELKQNCPNCGGTVQVLQCEDCEEPATVERYERDVNAASWFCKKHAR